MTRPWKGIYIKSTRGTLLTKSTRKHKKHDTQHGTGDFACRIPFRGAEVGVDDENQGTVLMDAFTHISSLLKNQKNVYDAMSWDGEINIKFISPLPNVLHLFYFIFEPRNSSDIVVLLVRFPRLFISNV